MSWRERAAEALEVGDLALAQVCASMATVEAVDALRADLGELEALVQGIYANTI